MKKGWIWVLAGFGIVAALVLFAVNNGKKTEDAPSVFYVPNAGEGTISVIDSVKAKTIDTISLGTKQASHGIAISPDGSILYSGTGFEGKTLVAINTKTKKIMNKIAFDEGVHGIDVSSDGKYLYVSLMPGLGKGEGTVSILNTKDMKQVAAVNTGGGPAHIAVTPDGSQVWVANVNGNTVAVIDTKTNKLIKTIAVGQVPNEVAVSADGKWAFVANVESNTVTVIDAKSMEVVKSIAAREAPHGVTVSPDSAEVWVANNKSNDVSIIDIKTFNIKATIPTGAYANHVAFSQDGKWAYVTNRQSNDVVKIDAKKKEVIAKIPVGTEPHEITLEDFYGKPASAPAKTGGSIEDSVAANADGAQEVKTAKVGAVEIEAMRLVKNDKDLNQSIDFQKYDVFQSVLTTHSGDLSSCRILK
ncbi:MAG: cytochrome D1 domain-containing protein [Ectobacillus sp.]